jgi:cytochrome oxidase Cu insertion factor (SCO1/SenC/PrrC family)
MRFRYLRPASLFTAVVLCAASTGVLAQGLYAIPGAWVDEHGRRFSIQSLRGSYSVVNMAYGACRRVCSASLRVLQRLQVLADERHVSLNVIVVGLDPRQDQPADWAAFRDDYKLQRANWTFLSGDPASTAGLARWLGQRYWHYGDHVMHDFRIVLVTPDGRIAATMSLPDQDPAILLP